MSSTTPSNEMESEMKEPTSGTTVPRSETRNRDTEEPQLLHFSGAVASVASVVDPDCSRPSIKR